MKTPEALRMVFEFIAVLSTIAEDGAHLNGALEHCKNLKAIFKENIDER